MRKARIFKSEVWVYSANSVQQKTVERSNSRKILGGTGRRRRTMSRKKRIGGGKPTCSQCLQSLQPEAYATPCCRCYIHQDKTRAILRMRFLSSLRCVSTIDYHRKMRTRFILWNQTLQRRRCKSRIEHSGRGFCWQKKSLRHGVCHWVKRQTDLNLTMRLL